MTTISSIYCSIVNNPSALAVPVTPDDIRHGIRKAVEHGVLDYCFVFTAGYSIGQEETIRQIIHQTDEITALLVDMNASVLDWTTTLNPIRRAKFGETVVAILRKDMRRAKIADKAAELWNLL
jgi:hypothetical protein